MKVKKTYRLEQETIDELEKLCSDSGKSATEVIEGAIHDAIRLPDTERAGEGWAQTVAALTDQLAVKDDQIASLGRALEAAQLEALERTAHELGMTVLLELHDQSELAKCRKLTTKLVGVNNRNLRTFDVSLQQTLDLLPELGGKTVVTESGITGKADVAFMQNHGVHTFLIGETFMRADNIEAAVKSLF